MFHKEDFHHFFKHHFPKMTMSLYLNASRGSPGRLECVLMHLIRCLCGSDDNVHRLCDTLLKYVDEPFST